MKAVTRYQVEILRLVKAGSPTGMGSIDFDELLDSLSWRPRKESAQFTIRALIGKSLMEKEPLLVLRRGRKRVCYRLTLEGYRVFDPRLDAVPGASVGAEISVEDLGLEVETDPVLSP